MMFLKVIEFKGERDKNMKEKRFVTVYSQGAVDGVEILVDKETGVNYLFKLAGYAGGLTPLLDENGKVVVTKDVIE